MSLQVSVEQRVAELSSTEVAVRRTALGDLTNLTGADATSSLLLRTQGVVPIVVRLLRDTDDEVTQLAAALLGNMLSDDAEVSSEQAVAEGAVEPLMTMLERPADPLAQRYAAGALCVIAGCRVETRPLLRRSAVQPLVVLLSSGDTCTQRRACTCLAALLQHDMPTLVAMRKAGGVPPLVAQLSSSEESVMERAAAVLGNVLADDILSRALAVEAGAVQVLVNLLSHDREDVQRYAAGCLMCILETSGKGQMAALKAGAVERLTHLAEAHSDSEAGKRARAALGYLKESW
jgi:HEAT repeat protein